MEEIKILALSNGQTIIGVIKDNKSTTVFSPRILIPRQGCNSALVELFGRPGEITLLSDTIYIADCTDPEMLDDYKKSTTILKANANG